MRRLLYQDSVGTMGSVGVLLLRLVVGVAFILHGWPKIQNPYGWMGENATTHGALQTAAAISEFCGGIALILGLLTRLAALGLIGTMAEATRFHLTLGHAFVGGPGKPSYELAAVYLCCAILFLLLGPGRLSLDALLFGRPSGSRARPAGEPQRVSW
jgi:putative oxidoreductase